MEARIEDLEVRYTLQQDLLRQLSDVIAKHDRELARLRAELAELRGHPAAGPLPFDPNETPPHY